MQRYIFIVLIVLAVFGAGIGFYLLLAKPATVSVTPSGSVSLPSAGQQTLPSTGGVATSGTLPSSSLPSPVTVTQKLVKLASGPIVPGEVVLDTKKATATSTQYVTVNFIEQQSGNVFSYDSNSKTLTRINNKTLPGISSASWFSDGSAALVRFLTGTDFSTVNTYILPAATSTGSFLPQGLAGGAVADGRTLALASGVNGSTLSVGRADGSNLKQVFTTPLSAISASFFGKNEYFIATKPTASLAGYAFSVTSAGTITRLAGPTNGLTALPSPSGKWVLVTSGGTGTLTSELLNVTTGTLTALPIGTIADKCVWASDDSAVYCGVPQNIDTNAAYPDDWYQGAAHFSDQVWKINVAGRYAELVFDFAQANAGTLDAEALAIDPAQSTLVFVNKNDGSLWSYAL